MALFCVNLFTLELCFPEFSSLDDFWLVLATGDILGKTWKVKLQPY